MVRARKSGRSLFEAILPDVDKLWPYALRRIDELLDDDELVAQVAGSLRARWPQSRNRGRPGTPAEVVLRMLVLEHLGRWSYDEMEHEVRTNLVYREFARVGCDSVPDAKTILRIARTLDPEVIQGLHARVVELAVEAGVVKGRKLRIDTTVIETNVHYPTDSTLLRDGARVLIRTVKRVEAMLGVGRRRIRDRMRSIGRRCLEMVQLARHPANREALARKYRQLLAIVRPVVRDGETALRRIAQRKRTVGAGVRRSLERLETTLRDTLPLVRRVIEQTRLRVFGGDTHVAGKVLSIFEPHTEAIRKGKVVKPTEFGKLVTIQEAEHQIISDYAVHARRPADLTLWVPALEVHEQCFGRVPDLAAGDRGFWSASNEQAAIDRGVRRVVLPRAGARSEARRAHERQRWFRRGLRWRVGSEGRISVLKRRHGLNRCLYRGEDGVERWVGLGVIASNLLTIATPRRRPAAQGP